MIALSFGKSHRQDLAATKTAAGQHVAAVLGLHAGAETMHLAALALFGRIRSEHNLSNSFTGPCLGQMYSLVIVHKTGGDVKHLPPFLKKTCAETAGTGPVRQKMGKRPEKRSASAFIRLQIRPASIRSASRRTPCPADMRRTAPRTAAAAIRNRPATC